MSRGLRNNNPGNIRHSKDKWQGEVKGKDPDFKTFLSIEWGYRAMFKLINNYKRKHGCNTLRKIINRWAPPIENSTDIYLEFVSKKSLVPADVIISTTNADIMIPIVVAMSQMENGEIASISDVRKGWELFVGASNN